jgi:hypothetical protein
MTTSSEGSGGRNESVGKAVQAALSRIDDFIGGSQLSLPAAKYRRACDELLNNQRPSIKTAVLFLLFYWLESPDWDLKNVPIGIRGKYGDKLLSEQLTNRSITLHQRIVAFGENLGWKGNVREFNLHTDPRFSAYLSAILDAAPSQRKKIADYIAYKFAESKSEAAPLPPIGPEVLSFARAKSLFYTLLSLHTEGHVQQFLIAALLSEFRKRYGSDIHTHHPHAADRFDETAGDIEEFRESQLVAAYEVTVRSDWENRINNFRDKMDRYHLSKYVIIAANVNSNGRWAVPANLALALEPYGRDIAVVDIQDVVNFLAADLSANELRASVNKCYEYLSDRKLSGRNDFMRAYQSAVSEWLDGVG